jgi:hypothetical protein
MTLRPEPPLVKIATASAPAETFSVTIRLSSLRAERTASSDFHRPEGDNPLRFESEQRPLRHCHPNAEHLFPSHGGSSHLSRRKKPPNFACASYWGSLTALLVVFPFTLVAL